MAVLGVALVAVGLVLLLLRILPTYLKFRRMELAIPGPPSLPVLGNSLAFLGVSDTDVVPRLLALWNYRTKLSRFSLVGGRLVVVVSDPDDIAQLCKRRDLQTKSRFLYEYLENFTLRGMITLNGSAHRAHRKLIRPAFQIDVLERFTTEFSEEAKLLVDGLTPNAEHDVIIPFKFALTRSFWRTSVASDMNDHAEAQIPKFCDLLKVASRVVNDRAFTPWLWSDWLFSLTNAARTSSKLLKDLSAFTAQIIADRRAQLSLTIADEDFIKMKPTLLDTMIRDGSLPEGDIMDEFHLFIAAAVDTTAATLSWLVKVLSVRPDVQARLHDEVLDVLGDAGVVGKCDLDKFEYMDRVVKETLRLLPALPFIARSNQDDTEFAGHAIPAKTTFLFNVFGVHRDARHWPDPLRFDPDRFTAERSEGRHPYAYVPFSAGSRSCIGNRYAMMLIKTVLATIVHRFAIDPVPDGHTEPSKFPFTFDISSRMVGGVRVHLRERTSASMRDSCKETRL